MRYQSFRLALLAFLIFQFGIPVKLMAVTETLSAGFAPDSVWVSKSNVVAGSSVNIFTVLYNSSDVSITGNLLFIVDNTVIGTKNFTIPKGETKIESFPWVAEEGEHIVLAQLDKVVNTDTNTLATLANQKTGNRAVEVSPAPPPSKTDETLATVKETATFLKDLVSSSAPIAASVFKSIYDTTENFRDYVKTIAEKKLATSFPSTSRAVKGKGIDFLPKVQGQAASVILSIVNSKPMFYLFFALLFFFLFLLIKTFFRSKRRRR